MCLSQNCVARKLMFSLLLTAIAWMVGTTLAMDKPGPGQPRVQWTWRKIHSEHLTAFNKQLSPMDLEFNSARKI